MTDLFSTPEVGFNGNDLSRSFLDRPGTAKSRRAGEFSDSILSPSGGPKSSTPFQAGGPVPFSPNLHVASNKKLNGATSPEVISPVPKARENTTTPTEVEHVNWFNKLIHSRIVKTAVSSGAAFSVISLVSLVLLQCSIWAPLGSVTSIVGNIFSLRFYSTIIIASILTGLTTFTTCKMLAHVNQTKRPSILSQDTHLALASQIVAVAVLCSSILHYFDWELVFDKRVFLAEVTLGCILCAFNNVFAHDFQLLFGSVTIKNFRVSLAAFTDPNFVMLLRPAAVRAAQICFTSVVIGSVLGVLAFGFEALTSLFNLSAHFALFIVFTGQIYIGYIAQRLCRLIVMQPLTFPFPPPYVVNNPTPEESRNLCAILCTPESLLKLFAVFDLRTVGCSDTVRRCDVFTLSQPAGHPRNWNCVCSVTFSLLDNIRETVDLARVALNGGDDKTGEDSDDDDSGLNREMLMMPPSARGQLFSVRTRNKHRAVLRVTKPVERKTPAVSEKLKALTLTREETGLISRYDAEIVILSIEGMAAIVVASLNEDRFGIIQRDLATVVRKLIQLNVAIDKYMRFKAAAIPEESRDDSLTRAVQDATVAALSRIGAKFQSYFREIGLSSSEIANYDNIVHNFFR